MKFAIQGHQIRGKEVIQILESLGGRNIDNLEGTYKTFYYINDENEISDDHKKYFPPTYKLYTLEEFEKEFPFKVGEVVFTTVHSTTFKGVVKNINFNDTIYPYDCSFEDSGKCSLGGMNVLVKCETNQLFKMKEERNITLTLEKAKEWYNKGGELKEIALQAFTEEELNPLPRSWEEFCTNYPIQDEEAIIDEQTSQIRKYNGIVARALISDKNVCASQKSAEAHLAMIQLEQLRNCWRQGWKPDWTNDQQIKYCVICFHEEFKISKLYETRHFLSFPTREIAEEFLKCFRNLIEKAGDLI